MKQRLILGGPGCGKTTRLMEIVEDEINRGVDPQEIAFVSFTNAAANQAKERAAERFDVDVKEGFPWFRTIHSMCYRAMEYQHDMTMTSPEWKMFSELVGEKISYRRDPDALFGGNTSDGDRLRSLNDFSAARLIPLVDAWHETGAIFSWPRIRRFVETLRRYKEDEDKIDFSDMIAEFNKQDIQVPVRVAIIDEAQDLTTAQWIATYKAFEKVESIYVAGDDDQMIYHWAGADLIGFHGVTGQREILQRSHRLPQTIFNFSQRITAQIKRRFHKSFEPADRKGRVEVLSYPDQIDLRSQTWFLLARNAYLLQGLVDIAREQGVTFLVRGQPSVKPGHIRAIRAWTTLRNGKTVHGQDAMLLVDDDLDKGRLYTAKQLGLNDMPEWFDGLRRIPVETREYYQRCLRNGDQLDKPPRIRIDTIHGVKGAEADNVLVLSDYSSRTEKGFYLEPDNEHRVFYVAATRARQTLWIVQPQTARSYPWNVDTG